jgi:6-pyruvoyltetrahydropterin/6-carboxytetrahydropterin synthase
METRRVRVERNRLRFAAAHFATFHGDCEPLHGHNYDVRVTVEGELTGDSWVWDFGDLKRITGEIARELDHRFILQRESRVLRIEETPSHWVIRFGEREAYHFPRNDVVVLPIDNTTVERLSEWMWGRIASELQASGASNIFAIEVSVEEMPGQSASYRRSL